MINSEYLYNSGAYKNLRIVLRIYTLFCRYANISNYLLLRVSIWYSGTSIGIPFLLYSS